MKIGVDKLFIVVSFIYGFIAIYTFPYLAPERTAPPYAARAATLPLLLGICRT
jgi:hypothetical protein